MNVGIEQTLYFANCICNELIAKNGKFKAVQNVFVIKIKVQFCIHTDQNQSTFLYRPNSYYINTCWSVS